MFAFFLQVLALHRVLIEIHEQEGNNFYSVQQKVRSMLAMRPAFGYNSRVLFV